MSYTMKQLSNDSISITENHWQLLVNDDDQFAVEYSDLFTWVRGHIEYNNTLLPSYAYGIFKNTTPDNHAYAIVDIIQRPHGRKMTKLLKIDVSPCLSDDTDITTLNEIVSVMLSAILGTLEISNRNASSEIKIYGRSSSMFGVLRELQKILVKNEDLSNSIDAKISGRWLEISLKHGK